MKSGSPWPKQDSDAEKDRKPQQHDDDVVGKAYDSRLMGRLLTYLRPYKLQAVISLVAILLKAGSDVLGPYLTKVAVDRYMTARPALHPRGWTRWLSPNAMVGVTQIASIYLATLVFSYLLEFVQTYLMQWTGQKVMFDMRSQIFRHIQSMHVSFFDRNPVGRLVTRLTSDVDALNEMFTSGVFAIFEDVFVLVLIVAIMLRMNWWLALIAFAVLPLILVVTRVFRKHVRDSYRRIRSAIARINASTQEHVSGMSVVQLFNREQRSYEEFEDGQPAAHGGLQRRHPGLCPLLPGGRVAELGGHRAGDLAGRVWGAAQCGLDRRAGRLYPVFAALLPAHSGPEREIQHPASGDGGQRTRLQAAGYAGGVAKPGRSARLRRFRPDRVPPCLVHVSKAGRAAAGAHSAGRGSGADRSRPRRRWSGF